jgi:hypothetical protein
MKNLFRLILPAVVVVVVGLLPTPREARANACPVGWECNFISGCFYCHDWSQNETWVCDGNCYTCVPTTGTQPQPPVTCKG